MKDKGFTLIELLAVIVILAVIALIATPLVMNTINDAKRGSLKDTAYGIIDAAEQYIYSIQIDGKVPEGEIDLLNTDLIKYSHGDFDSGKVYIDIHGNVALAISKGTTCIMKTLSEREVTITESTNCSFPFLNYNFGDQVMLGKDSYHVLEKTEEGYRLIKDESIGEFVFDKAGVHEENTDSNDYCNSELGYTTETYPCGVFKATDNVRYWTSSNTYVDTNKPARDNSYLYTYLNTEWKESLSYKNKIIDEVLLITAQEYVNLDGKNVSWLNNGTNFWTMDSADHGYRRSATFIRSDGKILSNDNNRFGGYVWDAGGVRPVITVSQLEDLG